MEISKICERIKQRRKELNLTQKELADAMHVSNQLVSKWETGESVPSLEYIQELSDALQISAQELMGIVSAAPEETAEPEPVPQPPKEKTLSKINVFWKKHKKPFVISIVSVAAALLILTFALLSVFVFVPMTHKEKYLEEIDAGIDRYLELDYFNIRHSTEKDGELGSTRVLKGYLDENGNACYYNSETDETVKDGKIHRYGTLSAYSQPESIKTTTDLLRELLKSWGGEDDFGFDLDETVTYIRRSGGTYYLKFSDEYLLGGLSASERKNIKLKETITGRAETEGGMTKSIEVSVRYRNTKENEDFSIDSKIEFLQEKPVIRLGEAGQTIEGTGVSDRAGFLSALNAVCYTAELSEEGKQLLLGNALRFENGYVFTYDESGVKVYDPKTFTLKGQWSARAECATVYYGKIWFVETDYFGRRLKYSTVGSGAAASRFDLTASSVCAFNGRYFYSYEKGDDPNGFVFDLYMEKIVLSGVDARIQFVDSAGNAYCNTQSDKTLFIFGKESALKGTEIVKEENGCIYTRDEDEPNVLYRYQDGVLQKTIHLPFSTYDCFKDCGFLNGSSSVYGADGNSVKDFSSISLKADNTGWNTIDVFRAEILAADEQFMIVKCVGTPAHSFMYDEYICVYRTGKWDDVVAYTTIQAFETSFISAKLACDGNKSYMVLFYGDQLIDYFVLST